MKVLSKILLAKQQARPLLAILIDPDKEACYRAELPHLIGVDLVLVGGSTGQLTDSCVSAIRAYTDAPVVLFPGNIEQFTPQADALLFLTLLNARTPEMLILPHLRIAERVLQSHIESIPMGYLLIDGGRKSSVEIVSKCQPISPVDHVQICAAAATAQLLGKSLLYLEAGSGAKQSVPIEAISAVRETVDIPLIVGGGICTPDAMLAAFEAGADVVVIGNHLEQNPDEIEMFVQVKREKYG